LLAHSLMMGRSARAMRRDGSPACLLTGHPLYVEMRAWCDGARVSPDLTFILDTIKLRTTFLATVSSMDLGRLRRLFKPHEFANQDYVDLYHVYDNLSRIPFQPGVGIQCEDPDEYFVNPWHVITRNCVSFVRKSLSKPASGRSWHQTDILSRASACAGDPCSKNLALADILLRQKVLASNNWCA